MKTCQKCHIQKPVEDFPNSSRHKDGKLSQCKDCYNRYRREYSAVPVNKEKRRVLNVKWRQANSDILKQKGRRRYRENPAKFAERQREYRRRNPNKKREAELRQKYGMALSDFEALLESQGGGCAICGTLARKMVVDHDHSTGRVRGILCDKHNRAIGLLGDDVETVTRAAMYLAEHTAQRIYLPIGIAA